MFKRKRNKKLKTLKDLHITDGGYGAMYYQTTDIEDMAIAWLKHIEKNDNLSQYQKHAQTNVVKQIFNLENTDEK